MTAAPTSPPPDDLEAILADCWTTLRRAVVDRRHPFRLPTLATTDHGIPDARTVVLRSADPDTWTIACHTDRRSPKFHQLAQHPQCAWVFYDPNARTQLRINTNASLHTDDTIADAAWAASHPGARDCYRAVRPPSTPAPGPAAPEPDQTESGRDRFAVVRARVLSIDWLFLHHAGHRRALFRPDQPPVWFSP